MLENNKNILLKEYEICHDSVGRIESNIWKTSGSIGLGSIGTLLLLIYKAPPWPVILIIGILVVVVVWIWWFMAGRWWEIQHATLLRMSHIEKDLDIYQQSYIRYKDCILKKDSIKQISEKLTDEELKELDDLKWPKRGVKGSLKFFPWLLSVIFGAYVIYSIFWN